MKCETRIGVFICECGSNIAGAVNCTELMEFAKLMPDVVCVVVNRYTCAEPGQLEIQRYVREQNLNRVVVASCTPKMHEQTFRNCVRDAGLNPYLMEMANIREQCSWVHPFDKTKATQKAKDLVKSAVARARLLEPQIELEVPVTQAALVIGGGIAGIQASLDIANSGYPVWLAENEPSIGGIMSQLNKTYPTID